MRLAPIMYRFVIVINPQLSGASHFYMSLQTHSSLSPLLYSFCPTTDGCRRGSPFSWASPERCHVSRHAAWMLVRSKLEAQWSSGQGVVWTLCPFLILTFPPPLLGVYILSSHLISSLLPHPAAGGPVRVFVCVCVCLWSPPTSCLLFLMLTAWESPRSQAEPLTQSPHPFSDLS